MSSLWMAHDPIAVAVAAGFIGADCSQQHHIVSVDSNGAIAVTQHGLYLIRV
ncbi:hypothetical protein D3C86_2049930 [compost metagenome]